ncbi:unnamed protein product [Penicillium camemberti]|uniref:Str. FM013 n=1 Tax=Penicillium camemberti (strain FM 013) TaxID=1429867 RepID=A0A0G4P0U3_PENC3|nr:unnamed protein product [Penicillium camemberti]
MGISWTLVKRCTKAHTNQPEITVKFTGYDLAKLEECWIVAVNRFFSPGGGAEQVGNIASYPHIPVNRLVLDNTPSNNGPIHRSSFNPEDKRLVLTFVVTAVSGEKKRCYVFQTGKGTKWIGDKEHWTRK